MKVDIAVSEHKRKATEYAVRVMNEDGKYLFCACPFTPYKAQADVIARAFEVFIANGGESAILEAVAELP
jgi:hypothetical protein